MAEVIELMNYRHFNKTNSAIVFNKVQMKLIEIASRVLPNEKLEEFGTNLVTHPAMVESEDPTLVNGVADAYEVVVQQRIGSEISKKVVSIDEYRQLKQLQVEQAQNGQMIPNPMVFSSVVEEEAKARRIG